MAGVACRRVVRSLYSIGMTNQDLTATEATLGPTAGLQDTPATYSAAGSPISGAKVLVTGASGFVGFNVASALAAHGVAVRAMLRRVAGGPRWSSLPGIELVSGDVSDPASLDGATAGVDSVIHTAALTQLMPRPRRQAMRVNVEGTRNVCEAALRAGVRRLVFTSSSAILAPGTADAPADEDSPFDPAGPRSAYYLSKWKAEKVVRGFAARGLETICLCPAYVIGPGDFRPTTNALILQSARSPLLIMPPGGINFIDVREVALAHVRALWMGKPGRRYVLAGPYSSYWGLARSVKRMLGLRTRGFVLPGLLEFPLAAAMAIASGVLPNVPDKLTVPGIRFGFVDFHMSGRRADAAFRLKHRPLEVTLRNTLRWFRSLPAGPLQRRFELPHVEEGRQAGAV